MDVRHLLFLHGKCPNPRLGRNSLESDWVATREWWWRTAFALRRLQPGERVFLRTRGVDLLGEFFVNGRHVGSSESFNQLDHFDITGAVRGENVLTIRLRPHDPAHIRKGRAIADTRVFKAGMFFGGDHNPYLINCGLARPPEIIIARGALVRSVRCDYTLSPDFRHVSGRVVLDAITWAKVRPTLLLIPKNFDGPPIRLRSLEFRNVPIRAWQPFNLGFPHCYDLVVEAGGQTLRATTGFRQFARRHNESFVRSEAASVLDWHPYENNGPFGNDSYLGYDAIREAGERWPETPREGHYDFAHEVNGKRFFVCGGSVVPTQLFWSDWSADYLRRLIREARAANHNTLRIWGGGYLSDDAFFEEADLQGVMIAQDFLNFATFKDRPFDLQQRWEREFRSVVRQLRLHPSVVVLNGGNELMQNQNKPLDPIFQTMERVVREETTSQYFHRSSPVNPEIHGPWFFDLDHAARYNSSRAIFNSECGCIAAPSLKSLRRVLSPAELQDVCGPAWRHRQPCAGYFDFLSMFTEFFGPLVRATPGDVVERSQVVQALAYQYLVEEYRRQYPRMSGFTTWEFNEPWIDFNWGLLDNALVRKHAFWKFQRAAAPRVISARFGSYVWAEGEPFTAELHGAGRALAVDAGGRVLARARSPGRITFTVPASPAFFLKLDGRGCRNDYPFAVLPRFHRKRPIRVCFLSGDCYENAVIHRFLAAAGMDLSAKQPEDADVTVLGPMFNPVSTLGAAFFERLRGRHVVYFAYNTSAYVCGRYHVDDLRGSPLEALLPVQFTDDCYRNILDYPPTDTVMRKTADHPVWRGIDLAKAPSLGLRVGVRARRGTAVLAEEGGEPALITHTRDGGRVTCFTGPYGGHQYQEIGFRAWPYAHRLLANIIEFTATGRVAQRDEHPHPLRGLLQVSPGRLRVRTVETRGTDTARNWRVTLENPGRVPLLFVDIGNTSTEEGATFDWRVSANRFILFGGERMVVTAKAEAGAGHAVPRDLGVTVTAWNLTGHAVIGM